MRSMAFFSYKGGSGRSSLIYNTLPFLARELGATPEKPIVVFDMDIDSMGLTYLFDPERSDYKGRIGRAEVFVHDILDDSYAGKDKIDDFLRAAAGIGGVYADNEIEDRSILLVPAKKTNPKESSLNALEPPFEKLLEKLEKRCAAVVFDCPSGSQVTGEISRDLADIYVVVMRITKQFRYGTFDFLKRMDEKVSEKTMVIVPNAVPSDEVFINGRKFDYDKVKRTIVDRVNDAVPKNSENENKCNTEMLQGNMFGIPEVKRLKIREDILSTLQDADLGEDGKRAREGYKTLAKIIKRADRYE